MGKSIPPCRENRILWGKLHFVGKIALCREKVDFCGGKKYDHIAQSRLVDVIHDLPDEEGAEWFE